ncbi:MAG: M15 family metallopeptidase, partial [Actinomycetota bacterium]|nr:M15 family metallopeptidase [Actinomycetota bacterium]
MSDASDRGWGSGWPHCQTDKIKSITWTQPFGSTLKLSTNVEMTALFPALINRLATARGRDYAQVDTGSYSCRAIKNTSIPSNHSWGLAADLEWNENPQGVHTYGTHAHNAGAIAKELLFRWGGPTDLGGGYAASDPYDCMHFEFMGTPAQARFLTAQLAPRHHPFERDWAWMARAYTEPFLYRVWADADIYAYCRANDIDQLTGISSSARVMRPTLHPGKQNPDSPLWPHIVFLQSVLNLHPELKFLHLEPNGDFGEDTMIAV